MSDKEWQKKDGRNKDKKDKAMRESVKQRRREAQPPRPSADQPELTAKG